MEEEIIQDAKLNEEEGEGEDVDHSSQASPFFLQMNLLLLLWASASSFEEIMDASHEYSDVMKNEEAIKSELGKKPTRHRRERIQIKEMVQRRPKFQTRINKDVRHSKCITAHVIVKVRWLWVLISSGTPAMNNSVDKGLHNHKTKQSGQKGYQDHSHSPMSPITNQWAYDWCTCCIPPNPIKEE
ncbi:hypothetical protein IFM89_021375 [Coptis chinensis]|uniref:Uncharacterized protein n=1 Tax=Coptis chinensis TaxID=261450 RepID=A0A835I9P7_9MAGN|nr:hypothetical protein IFM89_021375 [Coptis chinensis]